MAVGKFGMWITKTGRTFQLCYAYRNKDFRLKHQFYPNPNYSTLRVSGQVTREIILIFTSKESVFDWQEILPGAEKIIIKHLVKK